MASRIPLIPSRNNYTLVVPIDGTSYLFDNIHWNAFEESWYLDLREQDETPILSGIKLVLGVRLGRASTHPFFQAHMLHLSDTSGQQKDPGFDDLDDRVQLVLTNLAQTFGSDPSA
jgi:hypothetical protein